MVGLQDDQHVAAAACVVTAAQHREHAVALGRRGEEFVAGERFRHDGQGAQGFLDDEGGVVGGDVLGGEGGGAEVEGEVVARHPEFAGGERAVGGVEGAGAGGVEVGGFDAAGGMAGGDLGHGRDAVVGGEDDDAVVEADRAVDGVEERGEDAVEAEHGVHDFVAVGAVGVADVVDARKADGEQIGGGVLAEFFLDEGALGEGAEHFAAEGRGVVGVEERGRERGFAAVEFLGEDAGEAEVHGFAHDIVGALDLVVDRGGEEAVPGLAEKGLRAFLGVEGGDPGGEFGAVVAGGDEFPLLVPVGAVGALAAEEDGGAVFVGEGDDAGVGAVEFLEFVADGGGAEILRRAAGLGGGEGGGGAELAGVDADEGRVAVFDGVDLFPRVAVEPLVGDDAVVAGEGAAENLGVAGGGDGEGVAVAGVLKNGAALEEAFEPALAEVGAEAHEVVGAHLVHGDDDGEFGRGGAEHDGQREQEKREQRAEGRHGGKRRARRRGWQGSAARSAGRCGGFHITVTWGGDLADFRVGHGGAGFQPARVEDEAGEREKNEQVAGQHADLDGLGVAEFGGGKLAEDFAFRLQDQSLVGQALGVAAVEEIQAREEIDEDIGEQEGGADLHPPRDIAENFGDQILARHAAQAPDGENPDDEQQRQEKVDRIKRNVGEREDVRRGAGGGAEERDEEREAETEGHGKNFRF